MATEEPAIAPEILTTLVITLFHPFIKKRSLPKISAFYDKDFNDSDHTF